MVCGKVFGDFGVVIGPRRKTMQQKQCGPLTTPSIGDPMASATDQVLALVDPFRRTRNVAALATFRHIAKLRHPGTGNPPAFRSDEDRLTASKATATATSRARATKAATRATGRRAARR